jgi:AcrR family transcriptional regulator
MISDERILEAAILVFAYKPDATMEDIARQAGVTRITINRKFGSRADLLEASILYCSQKFDEVLAEAMSTDRRALEKLYLIMKGFSSLRNHYFFWMRHRVDDKSRDRQHYLRQLELIETIITRAQQDGELRKDLPAGWIAAFFDYMAITAATALANGVVAERDFFKLTWDTLLNGVAPKKLF